MSRSFSSHQVSCRPAIEHDLDDIREFCKTIWDGHDYVPEVMDDWLRNPRGLFAVAEYQGKAIACSKLTWLAPGQWWLEGFRVDPAYQGLRVGSRIHRYLDEWWLAHGEGVLRLMTSSRNTAVHHLCESTGSSKLLDVKGYRAEPLEGSAAGFSPAASSARDLEPLIEFARASPLLALTSRVVDFGWRFADPTQPGALACLFSTLETLEHNFLWWRGRRGLLIAWDDSDGEEPFMGIGVLACDVQDLTELLIDVRYLAAAQSKTSVFWLTSLHAEVDAALEQAGYASDWEHAAYLFEKRHPLSRAKQKPCRKVFGKSFSL